MRVEVVIPSYRPDGVFLKLLRRLAEQTVPVDRVIVMNTEEEPFLQLMDGKDPASFFPRIEVHHLKQKEFDHGGTRNRAEALLTGDVMLCMTQDALPADDRMVEKLTEALFSEEKVAAAYARQLPSDTAGEIERFTRGFNYPPEGCVKGLEQLDSLGIKAYFCSNSCAAYKRAVFETLGGFEEPAIFNEDLLYAARAILAGWKIAYAAEARVYHSHRYGLAQQFRRNFDNGVSQAQHPELFEGISNESEGMRLVKETAAYLCRRGKPWLVGRLCLESAAKYAGFSLGRRYRRLPAGLRLACSMSREYWEK